MCGHSFCYNVCCRIFCKVTVMIVCVLLQFVCWEQWQFSMIVLNDLLLEVRTFTLYIMLIKTLGKCSVLHCVGASV